MFGRELKRLYGTNVMWKNGLEGVKILMCNQPMLYGRVVRRELKNLCGTNVLWKCVWEGGETFMWNQCYVEGRLGRS